MSVSGTFVFGRIVKSLQSVHPLLASEARGFFPSSNSLHPHNTLSLSLSPSREKFPVDKNTATPKVTLQCHRAQLPMVTALFKTSFIQECAERFSVNPACAGIWLSAPLCFECLLFIILCYNYNTAFLLIMLRCFLVIGMNNSAVTVGVKSQNPNNNRWIEPGSYLFHFFSFVDNPFYSDAHHNNGRKVCCDVHFITTLHIDCHSLPICTVVCS